MRLEAPAPPVRLDIGAAALPRQGRFLVQHLVRGNLNDRHELAALVVSDGSGAIPVAAAALAPLLGNVLNGTSKNVPGIADTLVAACKNVTSTAAIAVIWNGEVSMDGVGGCPIYHHSGGRLTRLRRGALKLAVRDWLVLACAAPFDEATLQREIAAVRSSAVELAQRLAAQVGNGPVVVVYGY